MKYLSLLLNYLSAVLCLMVISNGCVKLDEDLRGQPTADKFFENESDFQSFITSAYRPLVAIYGSDMVYIAGGAAEDVFVPVDRWQGFEQANINTVPIPDEITEEQWDNNYKCIGICNVTLQTIKSSGVNSENLKAVEGEAKFLRALSYFNLTRWFRQVPLIIEDNQALASTQKDASVEDIYNQIVSDLKNAESNLPEVQQSKIRPTKWAAKSLLAKVYLTMAGYPLNQTNYYAEARDKAWEVIQSNKYKLEPTFSNLWLWNNRYTNDEFIFALYASADNGDATYVNRGIRPWTNNEGGWGDWSSDKRFLADFPVGDNSRIAGTFYLYMLNDNNVPWYETADNQPYVGKMRDAGDRSGGYKGPWVSGNGNADGFWSIIRFSDVLLIYAEAANQAEGGPSKQAYNAINSVRERAGLSILQGLSPKDFDNAVLDERNWELAFEDNRWHDICRRQLLPAVIKKYYPIVTINDHNYWLPKPYSRLSIWTGTKQNDGY